MKPNNEMKGAARQHPRYSALCILPDGTFITKEAAKAQGFAVLAVGLAAEPVKVPAQPLPPPLAPATLRPASLAVPAAVVADRARCQTLIDMTAKGAEAEAECRAANSAGTSPEAYKATVAARSILDAMQR